MKRLIYFEWLHFWRNRARSTAVSLFALAAFFGLYNGYRAYQIRELEVLQIKEKATEMHEQAYEWLESGAKGPEDRPWVDINTPFWSMWYASHYIIDLPKTIMTYNIGQSEHFGYYKRVSHWSTAYDNDLMAEIANPELIQLGAFDFSFVWLYLMPLLLIVLTYQTKGLEQDLGFVPLLMVQKPSINTWLIQRLLITGGFMILVLTFLVCVPVFLIPSLPLSVEVVRLWIVYVLYLLLWLLLLFLVIRMGHGQADQALKMIGLWLLLAVVLPGAIGQYIQLKKPADLMMSMIEASRDGQQSVYDLSKEDVLAKAFELAPGLKETAVAKQDSLLTKSSANSAYRLVLNEYMSSVSNQIMADQMARNQMISNTYWLSPVIGFHHWLNRLTGTDHEANLDFRREIQAAGERINLLLITDEWSEVTIDKTRFSSYTKMFDDQ